MLGVLANSYNVTLGYVYYDYSLDIHSKKVTLNFITAF